MTTLLNPWTNEGFFADVVVLVEGEDDRSALLGCASVMGRDLERMGISVIPCDGKNNIDRLFLIFSGLGIPAYVVFDGDKGDKRKQGSERTNRILQRLLGVCDPEDWPETVVTERYAIFERNLDEEIRVRIGDDCYLSTASAFRNENGYPDNDSCRKSPAFIRKVLEEGQSIGASVPALEGILDSVIALRSP